MDVFFIERYIKDFKKKIIQQRARPEGSIVEGYREQEVLKIHKGLMNSLEDYTPRIWKDDPQQKEKGKRILKVGFYYIFFHL
jgi:hypothetical protein